jgi:hypothetical protein
MLGKLDNITTIPTVTKSQTIPRKRTTHFGAMSIDLAKSRTRHMEKMAVTPDLHDQRHQKHGLVDQKCFHRSGSTEHGLDCMQQMYDTSREGGSKELPNCLP